MDISRDDRARQFLPFDALKGFSDAIKEKEIECVEKKELLDEQIEEICNKINELEKDNKVEITYYKNRQYTKMKGKVQKINYTKKKIVLYENININFADIFNINKL